MRLRQTPAARRDIQRMYRQSVERFGARHADRYYEGLRASLEHLLAYPESCPERAEYRPPIRIARYEVHRIAYRVEGDELIIVRVLHGRQDMRRYL